MKEKKQIVIVGYPKSGSTWLTRLVAHLVDCPVKNLWGVADNVYEDFAVEGKQRLSDFVCYKSHHPFDEFSCLVNNDDFFLIYIIRDPRDVIVSAANYLNFPGPQRIRQLACSVPTGLRWYNLIFENNIYKNERYRMTKMLDVLLFGSKEVYRWCELPWVEHVFGYLRNGVFFVRYEDLLKDAPRVGRSILEYLGVDVSDEWIEDSIRAQSFSVRKSEFISHGDIVRASHLREGKQGCWKKKMSTRMVRKIQLMLYDALEELGYA